MVQGVKELDSQAWGPVFYPELTGLKRRTDPRRLSLTATPKSWDDIGTT